jgi:CRP-like cAMP-binding protein
MPDNMLHNTDPYEVLRHSTLFGNLQEKTLKNMILECTEVTWRKADTVDHQIGEKYLFIIISGRLKVTHIDPNTGRSLALFLKGEGDIFDVFTLLDGKEHVIFPVVMDYMRVLRLPLARAREWISEHPEFNASFLPYLGEKMRALESFGTSLVFHDTNTRLAKLILEHTTPETNTEHFPVKLINTLSHESLAELIGSVRSVVSTQMHKLKEEGVIMNKRGHLAVSNLEKLMDKCDS